MTETEAMEILRAQGHAVGLPDPESGRVRIWIHARERSVDVKGVDLIRLAEGRLTMDDFESVEQCERKL